ncbi:unnamed protein product [Caenorhabditis bovis]|uniref:Uncharacterized protein n=1 Tax=Caenorhabditis bovis TaxID=2654633 RepID=A0A8S1F8Y5_9PELO|nr:unnamed protein product [Caenorhabditis bovis]
MMAFGPGPTAFILVTESYCNAIAEVVRRLEQLPKTLDLSNLLIDENSFDTVTTAISNSSPSSVESVNLSRCRLSIDNENHLANLIAKASSLKLRATHSMTGFQALFKEISSLKILEISACEFSQHSDLAAILKKCPNLENLELAAIKMKPTTPSPIPSAFADFRCLTFLDISHCSSWTSEQDLSEIFENCPNVAKLALNDVKSAVSFDPFWFPKLSEFVARRSDLEWCSLFAFFTSSQLKKIDLRASTVPENVVREFREESRHAELLS